VLAIAENGDTWMDGVLLFRLSPDQVTKLFDAGDEVN
jgi:hypothetical protein